QIRRVELLAFGQYHFKCTQRIEFDTATFKSGIENMTAARAVVGEEMEMIIIQIHAAQIMRELESDQSTAHVFPLPHALRFHGFGQRAIRLLLALNAPHFHARKLSTNTDRNGSIDRRQ